MIKVNRLHHGGIMANYRCTAACRHCLYACSPERTDGYISQDTAKSVCLLLRAAGCRSVHIGGGEPFLSFDGLLMLVRTAMETGVIVEYIETNGYWAGNRHETVRRLKELKRAGADTLCISFDPFHAEYVPIDLPLSLADSCREAGFRFFLWQERYYSMLSRLNGTRMYSRGELEALLSPGYVLETARSYGLSMGGRALSIEDEYSVREPTDSVTNNRSCNSLTSGNHFHVDMHGNYIPPGCTGITIPLCEAVQGIPEGNYPIYEKLLAGGSAELLRYAVNAGFEVDAAGYTSSCALCCKIRHWFCEFSPSPELDPEHYEQAVKYW